MGCDLFGSAICHPPGSKVKFYRIKDNWFSGHSFDLRQNVFATSKIDFIVSIAEGDHVVVERLLLADALGIRTANDVLLRDPMHRNDVVHDAWTTWQRPQLRARYSKSALRVAR